MPSIFIWKSDVPNTSKKYIRYYSGSNWFLEDNDYSTQSYMYLQQIVIPGCDDSVITFHVKKMPQDWVGSELLEVNQLPYRLIKSDIYGCLEQIGNWMRFIQHGNHTITLENARVEYEKIKEWMQQVSPSHPLPVKPLSNHKPNMHVTKAHYPLQSRIQPPSIPLVPVMNTQAVHAQFQEFLQKFNMNNIQHTQFQHHRMIPQRSHHYS
jgi:hypothetical protein